MRKIILASHGSMAEGVLLVHGLAGQARGDERHDAAGGVGQVVGGSDGNCPSD